MTASEDVHEQLRDAAAAVLDDHCSTRQVQRHADGDDSVRDALWKRVAALGWLSLALQERHGGSDLGFDALEPIYFEIGRHLAPLPLLESMLCMQALTLAGSAAQCDQYLQRIVSGELVCAVSPWQTGTLTRVDTSSRSTVLLEGTIGGVLGPHQAALLLLFVQTPQQELRCVLLDRARDGFTLQPLARSDTTRQLCTLNLARTDLPRQALLDGVDPQHVCAALQVHASAAIASDAAGGAGAILDLTVEYLQTRRQFGRPLASFQALKHRCADMKVQVELIRAYARQVSHQIGDLHARPDAATTAAASMSKFLACDAYANVAADAVQLHGGTGFTWEHYCHLFLKRAKLNQQLFGGPEWHRDHAVAALLQTCEDSYAG